MARKILVFKHKDCVHDCDDYFLQNEDKSLAALECEFVIAHIKQLIQHKDSVDEILGYCVKL